MLINSNYNQKIMSANRETEEKMQDAKVESIKAPPINYVGLGNQGRSLLTEVLLAT